MKCLFSIVLVFKLSIRIVALSSLYSKLRTVFTYSTIHIIQIIEGAFKILIGNKMPKYERAIVELSMFLYL